MSCRYRTAVVGCGRVGMRMEADPRRIKPATHMGMFASSPATSLCAVVDPLPDARDEARKMFPGVATYSEVEEMLESCRPDIVSVATPPDQHRGAVESCARRGIRAILCEKPIAQSPEDGKQMIEACRESGSLLFINHTRRFDPLIRRVALEVRKGMLGPVHHGNCQYGAGLFNSGTHLVDLLHYLLADDSVDWVSALPEERFTVPPGDLNVNGWIRWKRGTMTVLQALEQRDYAIFDINLFGSRGALTVGRFGFTVRHATVTECRDFAGYRELDWAGAREEGESRSLFAPIVDHIVECIEGRSSPVSPGEDGLRTLQVLHALRESAAQGGKTILLAARGGECR